MGISPVQLYDSSIEIHVLALTKDYSGPTQRQHQQRRCGGLLVHLKPDNRTGQDRRRAITFKGSDGRRSVPEEI
ncbi:hypothetical protein EVAR_101741_1 [Eumeta japonica]|uniref:Uncharacterized protein n=1 Tax=Eumeta variegata TaxID=151549 RepID=A0A4C1SQ72_EUMVA|nr:hypothetical protein EVAR_101741_1 [Eumeta japonica]